MGLIWYKNASFLVIPLIFNKSKMVRYIRNKAIIVSLQNLKTNPIPLLSRVSLVHLSNGALNIRVISWHYSGHLIIHSAATLWCHHPGTGHDSTQSRHSIQTEGRHYYPFIWRAMVDFTTTHSCVWVRPDSEITPRPPAHAMPPCFFFLTCESM